MCLFVYCSTRVNENMILRRDWASVQPVGSSGVRGLSQKTDWTDKLKLEEIESLVLSSTEFATTTFLRILGVEDYSEKEQYSKFPKFFMLCL